MSVWLHNVTIQCIMSSNSDSSVHGVNVQCTVSSNIDSVHSINVQCTVLIVYTASIYNVQCHQIVIVYTALEKVRFSSLKTAEI